MHVLILLCVICVSCFHDWALAGGKVILRWLEDRFLHTELVWVCVCEAGGFVVFTAEGKVKRGKKVREWNETEGEKERKKEWFHCFGVREKERVSLFLQRVSFCVRNKTVVYWSLTTKVDQSEVQDKSEKTWKLTTDKRTLHVQTGSIQQMSDMIKGQRLVKGQDEFE